MKRSLVILGIFLSGMSAFAQNDMNIYVQGITHPVNDSTIVLWGAVNTDHTQYAYVTNTSGSTIYIRAKYQVTTSVSGGENSFCWGPTCFGQTTAPEFESPAADTIHGNRTDSTFSGHYYDMGTPGTNAVRYVFLNKLNANDSSWVIVKYEISPTGIEQLSADALHMSAPSPNPAKNVASFNYHLNGVGKAVLGIYNTIGQNVQNIPVNSSNDRIELDITSLPSGIYICKLEAEGTTPVFQKMMVTH